MIFPCRPIIDLREINCGIFFLYWQSSGTSRAMNEREVEESLLLVSRIPIDLTYNGICKVLFICEQIDLVKFYKNLDRFRIKY